MNIRSCTAGLALALTVGASLPAFAGGDATGFTSQSRDFKFGLSAASEDGQIPAAILAQNWDRIYTGSQKLSFDQFAESDTKKLESVKLEIVSNISGVIRTFTLGAIGDQQIQAIQQPGLPYGVDKIGFASATQVGPLRAEADFGDYVLGTDGIPTERGILVNETGEGSAFTDMPGSLADYIGTGDIDGFVASCLMVNYSELAAGNAGGEGLVSGGTVTLTYGFVEGGGGSGPNAVPTPAALPAGILLMSALGLRRKRNADA